MRYTAANLVNAIDRLPKKTHFNYINPRVSTRVSVVRVTKPEGPITISRYSQRTGEETEVSISTAMIWRIASAFEPNVPIQFDRILGGSYNTRSAIEALLAHTPEFYWCAPGRIQQTADSHAVKAGHKHLIWMPEKPHASGRIVKFETDMVISELPPADVIYDSLEIAPSAEIGNIDVKRRHVQLQIALVEIGRQIDYRTWIARNDQGIRYGKRRIGELDGVVVDLNAENMLASHQKAISAALHIDCIWFQNDRFMPAVIEVEHSTGVTSGLTRMKNLKDNMPLFQTRWVIVAPDEDRAKVMTEANKKQFQDLRVKYFSYSAVDELYSLCQRRKLHRDAVNESFLDCFMEPCLSSIE